MKPLVKMPLLVGMKIWRLPIQRATAELKQQLARHQSDSIVSSKLPSRGVRFRAMKSGNHRRRGMNCELTRGGLKLPSLIDA